MTRTPRFSESIEAQHQRVDADDWDDIYVVGDVHGCLSELETLLDQLDPSDDDLVVFVGDLVRKGPDNHGVVDLVRSSPNMLSVRGNNEEKILRGEKDPDDLTDEDVEWIRDLPVVISWEGATVVHGGIDPRMSREEHTVDDLQNTRSLVPGGSYDPPFWWEEFEGPETVFFGHTVLEAPALADYAVGLDTGCVYGGELTAYDWHAKELVTLDVGRTVEERKDSKFIDPRSPVLAK
ncbi:serine/threonine protein phosphatase 1 [Halogranum gelatinilyticum]|uniref:Serine/threonine protein phosphatase 1 n=1 Tax=Halogranum gelatinilyticum TaxID=660521 RepID=A0A1G9UDB3_9EURY|nr:metallophosphoesterase family protein [Halogranum gelatinilyticum]SDM57910.1 serine/threonine protein phosphatase 1 [Halogranum gelatinilyticum]